MKLQVIFRAQALVEGRNRYFTGIPCPKGHIDERRVRDWHCMQCIRDLRNKTKRAKAKKVTGELRKPSKAAFVGPRLPKKQKQAPRRPTYESWRNMWKRCTYEGHHNYKNYGGRGITVCERWESYPLFLADMGERPEGKTLDRIDVNAGYSPDNCRWATPKEQAANKR